MVLIEHIGFGGRERDLFIYWWDTRDGADWSGWWCTPDFVGNNDFILHCATDSADPCACPVGEWRSPHFENSQLRRRLQLGFMADGAGQFCACGDDAGTAIIPDGISRIDLSAMVFKEDGQNHGRPCFRAFPKPVPAAAAAAAAGEPTPATPRRWALSLDNPIVGAALCIALGVVVGAAAARRRV